ncbi:MAG: hypothetical protein J5526_06670 [Bacteroidales bacterium]|nr:hypothetical protein [Bacteroidales bacterium]
MNTTAINSYSAEILQNLGAISGNEDALARLSKYLRRLVKEQENDPTLMTEEEFFARVDKARESLRQGKGKMMLPGETLSEFLKRVD